ncbi:unnamed protein product [Owenia fusiformis]|uniref:Chitinase n=1 Tax=Owenia fusiformis TaxID=6347 RepID=A0A8S4PHZ1_OWEFU|nr:unnamed protein product [Owenia fusiformis]
MRNNGFAGVMVWSVDLDDFDGTKCRSSTESYPLLRAINRALGPRATPGTRRPGGRIVRTTPDIRTPVPRTRPTTPDDSTIKTQTTRKPDGTTRTETTTRQSTMPQSTRPGGTFDCLNVDDGTYPNPNDCTGYVQCNHGIAHIMPCAPGLVFNPLMKYCDWPYNVPNCKVN